MIKTTYSNGLGYKFYPIGNLLSRFIKNKTGEKNDENIRNTKICKQNTKISR